MKSLYTKEVVISMSFFVKLQNCVKWQTDTCLSVQNAQNPGRCFVLLDCGRLYAPASDNFQSMRADHQVKGTVL